MISTLKFYIPYFAKIRYDNKTITKCAGNSTHEREAVPMDNNDFGTRLKQLRETRGYTQKSLADAINRSLPEQYPRIRTQSISSYEAQGHRPKEATLRIMAQVLNVTVDYLVGKHTENYSSTLSTIGSLYRIQAENIVQYAGQPVYVVEAPNDTAYTGKWALIDDIHSQFIFVYSEPLPFSKITESFQFYTMQPVPSEQALNLVEATSLEHVYLYAIGVDPGIRRHLSGFYHYDKAVNGFIKEDRSFVFGAASFGSQYIAYRDMPKQYV